MPPRLRICLSVLITCLIAISGLAGAGWSQAPAVKTVEGLGKGTAELDGPWLFHTGDDLVWAQPEISDTAGQGGWETILPDRPWGTQGHYAYAGFGWYRLHLHITPATGFHSAFQLLLPGLQDACEVYWNGKLVGRYGSFPPHPSWPGTNAPAAFTLTGQPDGVLAIRIWKGPLGSSASGYIGGLTQTPLVGDPASIRGYVGVWNYNFLLGTLDPEMKYEEIRILLKPGDRCSLYTDGLLEARAPSGEIFSFERLQQLFSSHPDAAKASAAAVSFGQEDDITVLTLTRTNEA